MLKKILRWLGVLSNPYYNVELQKTPDYEEQYNTYMRMMEDTYKYHKVMSNGDITIYSPNTVQGSAKIVATFPKPPSWSQEEWNHFLKTGDTPEAKLHKDQDIIRFEGEGGPAHD